MAKQAQRLTARRAATETEPGRHADGDGLYLLVTKAGARSWAFLCKSDGRRREMGLGPVRLVSLAEARAAAREAREHERAGRDPIRERERTRARAGGIPTFGAFSDALMDDIEAGFRNEKHKAQWRMTLTSYAARLRMKRVDAIETTDVLAVLTPIWQAKTETAARQMTGATGAPARSRVAFRRTRRLR